LTARRAGSEPGGDEEGEGVVRMRRSVARREVVAEEKTFGELGMASANSPPRRRVG
jgi:hypothetical protein